MVVPVVTLLQVGRGQVLDFERAASTAGPTHYGSNLDYATKLAPICHLGTGPRFVEVNTLGHIYTAFAQQVMRSTDNGATWKQVDDDETSPGSGNWVGRGNSNLPGEL